MSDAPAPDRAAAPASPPSRQRALAILAALLFAGLVVPLVAILLAMRGCSRSTVSGRLELAGSTFGDHRLAIDRCEPNPSAPDEILLGNARAAGLVRVTIDPLDGPILVLYRPPAAPASSDPSERVTPPPQGDGTITVQARPCPGFHATLKRTSAADATVPRYDGEISGTCPLPGGGTVAISVWFRGC